MTESSNPQHSGSAPQLAPEVAALFPPGVVAAELRGDGDPALLTERERQVTERFVPKRLKEFAAGRACARLALAELGIEGFSLLPAPDRQAVWPATVAGSITHTDGYCAVAVAHRTQARGLGIDSEVVTAVHEELWPRICAPSELAWLQERAPRQRLPWAALVFAAKECFYKCQYPVTLEWLDFSAVEIELTDREAHSGSFLVRARRPIQLEASARLPLPGQFRFHERWVTAAMALT